METGVLSFPFRLTLGTDAAHEILSFELACVPHEYNSLALLSGEERRVCSADDACSHGLHPLHPVNLLL